jgi:hypothetical protein
MMLGRTRNTSQSRPSTSTTVPVGTGRRSRESRLRLATVQKVLTICEVRVRPDAPKNYYDLEDNLKSHAALFRGLGSTSPVDMANQCADVSQHLALKMTVTQRTKTFEGESLIFFYPISTQLLSVSYVVQPIIRLVL